MQDLEKARTALDNLPIEGDAQSGYFAVVLRRLFTWPLGSTTVASRAVRVWLDMQMTERWILLRSAEGGMIFLVGRN
jgi:hypothetical protein